MHLQKTRPTPTRMLPLPSAPRAASAPGNAGAVGTPAAKHRVSGLARAIVDHRPQNTTIEISEDRLLAMSTHKLLQAIDERIPSRFETPMYVVDKQGSITDRPAQEEDRTSLQAEFDSRMSQESDSLRLEGTEGTEVFHANGYNFTAKNAVPFFPSGMPGGSLLAFMSAKETHGCICFLIANARPDQSVQISCFTYDLEEISRAIMLARSKRVRVTMCCDHRTTLGQQTREQLNRIIALRAVGVQIYLVAGLDIRLEYAAVSRSVRPGFGILHQKTVMVGRHFIVGSTNFTTSSRNNHEISALLWLHPEGATVYQQKYDELKSSGEILSDASIEEAEIRREHQRTAKEAGRSQSRGRHTATSSGSTSLR